MISSNVHPPLVRGRGLANIAIEVVESIVYTSFLIFTAFI